MPKPKSGNDPWKAVAVKLPPDLLEEVGRYADLYHTSVSALIREGLDLRMRRAQSSESSSGITVLPPVTAALLPQLAETLDTIALELRKACHSSIDAQDNTVIPESSQPAPILLPSGDTVILQTTDSHVDAEHTVGTGVPTVTARPRSAPQPGMPVPQFDATKFILGAGLCPQGHDFAGTGRSLLRRSSQSCRECDNAQKRAKRAAQRA